MSAEKRKKNIEKGFSYAEAWRRIKDAMTGKFYFEVVTLCESIISDRLLSYVKGRQNPADVTLKTPFSQLIKKWRNLARGPLPSWGSSDLGAQ